MRLLAADERERDECRNRRREPEARSPVGTRARPISAALATRRARRFTAGVSRAGPTGSTRPALHAKNLRRACQPSVPAVPRRRTASRPTGPPPRPRCPRPPNPRPSQASGRTARPAYRLPMQGNRTTARAGSALPGRATARASSRGLARAAWRSRRARPAAGVATSRSRRRPPGHPFGERDRSRARHIFGGLRCRQAPGLSSVIRHSIVDPRGGRRAAVQPLCRHAARGR